MVDANPKGIDREMFLVLRSLGLQVGVKPVLDRATLEQRKPNTDDHYVLACESTRDVDVEAPGGANKREALDRHEQLWGASILAVRKEAEVESRLPRLVHNPSPLDDETMAYRTFSQRLEEIITTRQIRGLPVWEPPPFGVDRVGHSFDVDVVDHDCHLGDDSMLGNWTPVYGIQWLNKPREMDLAMTFIAYGNQAEMGHLYASAAIIARVPPSGLKMGTQTTGE